MLLRCCHPSDSLRGASVARNDAHRRIIGFRPFEAKSTIGPYAPPGMPSGLGVTPGRLLWLDGSKLRDIAPQLEKYSIILPSKMWLYLPRSRMHPRNARSREIQLTIRRQERTPFDVLIGENCSRTYRSSPGSWPEAPVVAGGELCGAVTVFRPVRGCAWRVRRQAHRAASESPQDASYG